ncbi:hypothetical protein M413DRAFT_449493 [Hebeloma cylindrosporum]|uniref:Uncharacterized protein n=1 Tax=Hebeloma cylindrosporum TaxID=76867 RepID=A0A0C2XDG8_HEBCY|nr:hypothetical protein M413DRAFT_449493 [Hebeloma cylindrosporum h7]
MKSKPDRRRQEQRAQILAGTDWKRRIKFYWYLRTYIYDSTSYFHYFQFLKNISDNRSRSIHLQFLLEKSGHSDPLLNFARRRVFRFRYLHRKHPTYIKKAIFALAKYIQRVTGGTAEVRACESLWGHGR